MSAKPVRANHDVVSIDPNPPKVQRGIRDPRVLGILPALKQAHATQTSVCEGGMGWGASRSSADPASRRVHKIPGHLGQEAPKEFYNPLPHFSTEQMRRWSPGTLGEAQEA